MTGPLQLEVDPRAPLLPPALSWRRAAHCFAGVTALYLADTLLTAGARLAHIHFPSALIGLFLIVAGLLLLARRSQRACDAVTGFFRSGVDWVAHRWLPIFYIPALVMLPLAIQPLSGERVGGCVCG